MAFIKGIISKWDDHRGFGFIKNISTNKEVFFHVSQFSKRYKNPVVGLHVKFQLSVDKENRKCAVEVVPINGHGKVTVASKQLKSSLILSFVFFFVIGGLVFIKKLPILIFYIYLAMSILLFLMYAKDKSAAQKGKWRTPESTLHLFSLMGGWPGATIAQSKLRHKSKKLSFRAYYWLTVIINCCVLGWLSTTQEGQSLLEILK